MGTDLMGESATYCALWTTVSEAFALVKVHGKQRNFLVDKVKPVVS
jgi:hypothetical protein